MLEKDQGAFRISPVGASGSQLASVTWAPLSWTSPCPSCKEASKRKSSSDSRWVGAGKGEEETHLSALGFFSSSHLTHCGFNTLLPKSSPPLNPQGFYPGRQQRKELVGLWQVGQGLMSMAARCPGLILCLPFHPCSLRATQAWFSLEGKGQFGGGRGRGLGSVRTPISPTPLPGRPYPQAGLGWLGPWAPGPVGLAGRQRAVLKRR